MVTCFFCEAVLTIALISGWMGKVINGEVLGVGAEMTLINSTYMMSSDMMSIIIIQEVEDTARENFLSMNKHWTASVHQTFSRA